jgi:hypothetical protein
MPTAGDHTQFGIRHHVSASWPLDAAAVDHLTALVGRCLKREAGTDAPLVTEFPCHPDEFIRAVRIHQVAPLLAAWANELGMPTQVSDQISSLAREQAAAAMTVAVQTQQVCRLLSEHGITVMAYKGVVLSVQTTGTLAARGSGDIDILVTPDDVLRSMAVLGAAGWQPAMLEIDDVHARWPWLRWSTREWALVGELTDVDLHWRVPKTPGLLPTTQELHERAVTIELPGGPVLAPSREDLLPMVCYTASADGYSTLKHLIDVVRAARLAPTGAMWSREVHALVDEATGLAAHVLQSPQRPTNSRLSRRAHARSRRLWAKHRLVPRSEARPPLPIQVPHEIWRTERSVRAAMAVIVHLTVSRVVGDYRFVPKGSDPVRAGRFLRGLVASLTVIFRPRHGTLTTH